MQAPSVVRPNYLDLWGLVRAACGASWHHGETVPRVVVVRHWGGAIGSPSGAHGNLRGHRSGRCTTLSAGLGQGRLLGFRTALGRCEFRWRVARCAGAPHLGPCMWWAIVVCRSCRAYHFRALCEAGLNRTTGAGPKNSWLKYFHPKKQAAETPNKRLRHNQNAKCASETVSAWGDVRVDPF